MVEIRPIHTEAQHKAALKEIEKLWGAKRGTSDGNRLEVLALLVEAYEKKACPIGKPDPIEAIMFRMEQMGYTQKILRTRSVTGAASARFWAVNAV